MKFPMQMGNTLLKSEAKLQLHNVSLTATVLSSLGRSATVTC